MNSERASYVIWALLVVVGIAYAIAGGQRPISIAVGLGSIVLGIGATIWTKRRSTKSSQTG